MSLKSITPDNSVINTLRKYHDVIFLILAGVLFFSFTLSKALISISFGLICLMGITGVKGLKDRRSILLIFTFLLFYTFMLVSCFISENADEAIRKIIVKVPVLLFPLAFFSIRQLTEKSIFRLAIVINYALYVPAVVSVYNYLINKELFDDLILQSKPLPIEFGYGILHINFSILLACAVLFGTFQLYRMIKNGQFGLSFYMLLILVIANFIFIHILSTRTGLVGLYAGLAVFCFYLFTFLPFRKSRWLLVAVVLVPIALFFLSSSLQNRITNTIEDFKVVIHHQNANDYSFAMRVKAWQNGWDVIKDNPFFGVGIGDAETVLFNNFATFDPSILPENRKNPHFQFIETAVQSGLICSLIYMMIFVFGFLKSDKHFNFSLIALMLLLFIASCFESILESQVSVIAFVFFIALNAVEKDFKKA